MKVLQIVASLRVGGAEKLVCDLATSLNAAGVETDVAVFCDEKTIFSEELAKHGLNIMTIHPNDGMYSFDRVMTLRKLLKEYDIVHTHTTPAQLAAAMASIGAECRLVTTEHSTNNRRRESKLWRPFDRLMYGRYDAIVGCSNETTESLRGYLPNLRSKLTTIFNGVDIEKIRKNVPCPEIMQGMPGRTNMVMVGRMCYPKDQQTLVRTAPMMSENFHFWFAGDGSELSTCKALSKALGVADRCHFLGNRSDIAAILKAADIYVHSSQWEGLPLSILEAMAAGLPVIATDAKGIRDIVKGAGVLVPPSDPVSMADAIQGLDFDRIRTTCSERIKDYDLSAMTQKYIDLYNLILHRER